MRHYSSWLFLKVTILNIYLCQQRYDELPLTFACDNYLRLVVTCFHFGRKCLTVRTSITCLLEYFKSRLTNWPTYFVILSFYIRQASITLFLLFTFKKSSENNWMPRERCEMTCFPLMDDSLGVLSLAGFTLVTSFVFKIPF